MSRHPFSRFWKGPIAFVIAAIGAFAFLLWTNSYRAAIGVLVLAVVGYAAYALGESSDLPGTTGKGGKNIRT